MPVDNKSDFILLSKLIQKLEDKDYYRTYAKTLAYAEDSNNPIPPDEELVREMFNHFIRTNQLEIHFNGSIVTPDFIKSVARQRSSVKTNSDEKIELKLILQNEIYIKLQDLKKLYANKCIVFPNSLLKECSK